MNKPLAVLLLVITLAPLAACLSPGSSAENPRYVVVDAVAAKELFDHDALFIDVRSRGGFDERHIAGAVNMTWGRRFTQTRLAEVADKDQEIVIYCYGIPCEMSAKATDAVVRWGYSRVHYFTRGFPSWWSAGYPIEE